MVAAARAPGRATLRTLRGNLLWLRHRLRRTKDGSPHRRDPMNHPASDDLRNLLERHAHKIRATTADDAAGDFFVRAMLNTWERTLHPQADGTVFVITGDIPAMWLRDSSAQLRPFLVMAPESAEIRTAIAGVIARQWAQIAHDPYANAFNAEPNGSSWHSKDLCQDPWIWEQKYEIDSLAFPVQLAHQYWQVTGDPAPLRDVHTGARRIIELWRREQDHEAKSDYRFVRTNCPPTDTLGNDGHGSPVAVTGMTWSGFRPSDDACVFHYNIPAQLHAVHALGLLASMARELWQDAELADEAEALAGEIRQGVEDFGIAPAGHYAYEVDGLGNQLLMDDANMPSLLSLPLCSDLPRDDERYLATRAFALSPANPHFHEGRFAKGIGSPHTPPGYIWHIALAVQGLTATDEAEAHEMARTLLATTGGTGLMHEGFVPDDPTKFTRPWFSWSNSMACELLLSLTGRKLV